MDFKIKDSVFIYVYQFVAIGLTLLATVVVSREGGALAKGQFDLFLLFTTLIQDVGFLGIAAGLLTVYSIQRPSLGKIHGTGIFLSLLGGGLVSLLGLLTQNLWLEYFFGVQIEFLFLILFLSPLIFYRSIWQNISLGVGLAPKYHFWNAVNQLFIFLGLIACIWFYQTFEIDFYYKSYIWGLVLLTPVIYFLIKNKSEHRKMAVSREIARNSLVAGLGIYFGFIFNILHFRLDQLMINHFLTLEDVGIYALAARLAEGVFLLEGGIIAATWSKVMNPGGVFDFPFFKKIVKVQGLLVVGACLLIALLSPVIPMIWGEEFRNAIRPLLFLLPGILFWSISKMYANYLVFKAAEARKVSVIAGLGLLINFALNYVFLAHLKGGIDSVAIASSTSYMVVGALIVIYSRRHMSKVQRA